MATSPSVEDGLARGCNFSPADHVLIEKFLRPKVTGLPLPIDSRYNIHDFDAYSVSPDDLVGKREHARGTDKGDGKGGYWYFFTPARRHETTKTKNRSGGRRQRAVGECYEWHSEAGAKEVLNDSRRRVGYKRSLTYRFRSSPKEGFTRLGWCMTEFSLDDDAVAGVVLCKICVSRHLKKTTYDAVMKATADSKKRKASDDPHPDAPRPQIPWRREVDLQEHAQLQQIERLWLYSDEAMTVGALEDSSLNPADDIIEDVEELGQQEDSGFQATYEHLQEPVNLQDLERRLHADEDEVMPPGAVEDGSVDPAGFYADILDVEELRGTQHQRLAEDEYEEEVTYAGLFGDDDMDLVTGISPAPTPAYEIF